jgi:hypothetical protein
MTDAPQDAGVHATAERLLKGVVGAARAAFFFVSEATLPGRRQFREVMNVTCCSAQC